MLAKGNKKSIKLTSSRWNVFLLIMQWRWQCIYPHLSRITCN